MGFQLIGKLRKSIYTGMTIRFNRFPSKEKHLFFGLEGLHIILFHLNTGSCKEQPDSRVCGCGRSWELGEEPIHKVGNQHD